MKTIHSQAYKVLLDWLVSKRLLAGVTQYNLSEKLRRPQSFVSKYENGERRLDLIETILICDVLDINPHEVIDLIQEGKNEYKTNN